MKDILLFSNKNEEINKNPKYISQELALSLMKICYDVGKEEGKQSKNIIRNFLNKLIKKEKV